eukprot:5778127-Prymnesium_polylepis.1
MASSSSGAEARRHGAAGKLSRRQTPRASCRRTMVAARESTCESRWGCSSSGVHAAASTLCSCSS